MKALILNGSPKKKGSTNLILTRISEGLNDSIIQSELINISDFKLNYCTGCEYCMTHLKCIQNDDIHLLTQKIIENNIIVIGSPSYWGYVTGQLKVFFDRCTPLCNTNPSGTIVPKGKIGFSIALRAGKNKNENLEIINAINHFYSHLEIIPVGSFTIENISNIKDIKNNKELLKNVYNIGAEFKTMCQNVV